MNRYPQLVVFHYSEKRKVQFTGELMTSYAIEKNNKNFVNNISIIDYILNFVQIASCISNAIYST